METTPFRTYQPGTQPPYDAPAYGSTHKRHPQQGLVRLPHTITEISGARFTAAQFPPIPDLSVGKSRENSGPHALRADRFGYRLGDIGHVAGHDSGQIHAAIGGHVDMVVVAQAVHRRAGNAEKRKHAALHLNEIE